MDISLLSIHSHSYCNGHLSLLSIHSHSYCHDLNDLSWLLKAELSGWEYAMNGSIINYTVYTDGHPNYYKLTVFTKTHREYLLSHAQRCRVSITYHHILLPEPTTLPILL
jgi:hypothetical protein